MVFTDAVNLAGEFFDAGHEDRVEFLGQIDVVVFFTVGQVNYLALEFQQ